MPGIESEKLRPVRLLPTLLPKYCHQSLEDCLVSPLFSVGFLSAHQPLSAVIAHAPIVLFALDAQGVYTLSEGQGLEGLGLKPGQMVGHSVYEMHRDRPQALIPIRRAFAGESLSAVAEVRGQYFETCYTPIKDGQGRVVSITGFSVNVTARVQAEDVQKRIEAQLRHLAYYDTLTGLPNREGLLQRLTQALEETKATGQAVGVLRLNIDNFRDVNDSLGYEQGNDLLRAIGSRLLLAATPGQTVARLAGDEFGLVAPDLAQAQDVMPIAQALLESLAIPFRLGEQEVFLSAGIGIAVSSGAVDSNAASLLEEAHTAQGRAKSLDKNCFQLYSPDMRARIVERRALESPLHHALERNEFRLHFQPRVDLPTGKLVGVEALLRWQNPELGMVPPAQFIPLAEEIGLILPIGEWVLRQACAQNQAWQALGLDPVRMAVNLSARQFAQADLVERIAQVLAETGLDPRLLELELTESMVMQNAQANISTLRELRQMGVTISIDDFGTGYSSLSYLKRLPIHALKIDRAFVNEVTENNDDAAIVKAILAMAHSLRLHVVAEGVETPAQLEFLRAHGCDEVQGYLFSRPLPAEEVIHLFRPVVNV